MLLSVKGIVIAGGMGKRLLPLTQITNKALLPIAGRPMISYPLETLTKAGIREVMAIISGPFAGSIVNFLKDGREFGLKRLEFSYREGGTLAALLAAEDFSGGEPVAVIYADNILEDDISTVVSQFKAGAMVFLKEVKNPGRYAVAAFSQGKIKEIEEKPKEPKSNKVTVGAALYDQQIFEIARQCRPSIRGELEIPDANKIYLSQNKLRWFELKKFWCDAGTFEGLALASRYWEGQSGISQE